MIENLKYDEKTVSWNTKSGKRVEKTHNSIVYLRDEMSLFFILWILCHFLLYTKNERRQVYL